MESVAYVHGHLVTFRSQGEITGVTVYPSENAVRHRDQLVLFSKRSSKDLEASNRQLQCGFKVSLRIPPPSKVVEGKGEVRMLATERSFANGDGAFEERLRLAVTAQSHECLRLIDESCGKVGVVGPE
mmetsp:Transcript_15045/g.47299  ORF Transcript_15045/g.47299 Transcript_15045/m.47299 type:complete len:128 (-) Transcript_15045:89-472(-)